MSMLFDEDLFVHPWLNCIVTPENGINKKPLSEPERGV